METLDQKLALVENVKSVNGSNVEQVLGRYAYWNSGSKYDKLGGSYNSTSCSSCGASCSGGSCHGDGSCGGDGE